MVTDFLFGFRTLSYADLTLSHCNIDLLFVNLVNLVNLVQPSLNLFVPRTINLQDTGHFADKSDSGSKC